VICLLLIKSSKNALAFAGVFLLFLYISPVQAVNCPPSYIKDVGGQCVCPTGTVDVGGQCVSTTCPIGQIWNGSTCVLDPKQCPTGQYWDGAACQTDPTYVPPTSTTTSTVIYQIKFFSDPVITHNDIMAAIWTISKFWGAAAVFRLAVLITR
jgi:hypothetical protein